MVWTLNLEAQDSIQYSHGDYTAPRYLKDGKIDMQFLISDFQEYWRENSEIWADRYKQRAYKFAEAAPHLVMQAFLLRVVNGGGQIIREMALGTKRADLCILYGGHKYPIELKILRNEKSLGDGLRQLSVYMDKLGADAGWLVLFDGDTEKSWNDKIYMRKEIVGVKEIIVAGC